MRRDKTWLPPGNLEISYRLDGVIRRLRDAEGSNRWLHHRWIGLTTELREDLLDSFAFPRGFVALCVGTGTRNGLSFPLLIGLMGASRVEALEPVTLDADDEWRILHGLGETALHVLAGEVRVSGLDITPEGMARFVRLGPLLRGEGLADSLASGLVWKQGTAESSNLAEGSVDLVTSRSVMEHVANPAAAYAAMAKGLRPGGVLHHDIDFTAHDADPFAFYWRPAIGGAELEGLNELRLSDHLAILRGLGLEVKVKRQTRHEKPINRNALEPRFAKYDEEDLTTTRAVLVAKRM